MAKVSVLSPKKVCRCPPPWDGVLLLVVVALHQTFTTTLVDELSCAMRDFASAGEGVCFSLSSMLRVLLIDGVVVFRVCVCGWAVACAMMIKSGHIQLTITHCVVP